MNVLLGILDGIGGAGGSLGNLLEAATGAVVAGVGSLLDALFGLFSSRPAAVAAGAGAAGALSYRWWKYGFFSLFTRIIRPKALDQPTRARIFEFIQTRPGVRAQHIEKGLDLATGQTMHHLRMLERQGLITRTRNAFARRYFVTGSGSAQDMMRAIVDSHPGLSAMHRTVAARPGSSVSDLADALGLSRARVSRMARQLADAGIVDRVPNGREVRIFPKG